MEHLICSTGGVFEERVEYITKKSCTTCQVGRFLVQTFAICLTAEIVKWALIGLYIVRLVANAHFTIYAIKHATCEGLLYVTVDITIDTIWDLQCAGILNTSALRVNFQRVRA